MRRLVFGLMLIAGSASAQGLPSGLSAGEAMMLYQALTPQQRQMLAVGALRGRDSLSAAEALAWYQSMTPRQKEQAKAWAKQQGTSASGLKDSAKALVGR
jgi:hypothetical protein